MQVLESLKFEVDTGGATHAVDGYRDEFTPVDGGEDRQFDALELNVT